jgi:predicted MFS family arabinose efflux permease
MDARTPQALALPDRRIVVPALGVTQILAWGSTFYLPGVLANPIARETGWSYDWVIGGITVGLLVAGIVSPRVGRAIGEHGGRPVLAIGALCLAGGLALLGLASNLGLYLGAWLLIGAGMGAGLYDAAFSTLGAIYGKDARGAITFVTLFGGFASTVCWPLSALLVEHLGWRGACFAYAAMQIGISLPILFLALPRHREAPRADAATQTGAATKLTRPELPVFVLLAAVLTLGSTILSIVGVHLLPLLQARGIDLATAVAIGTLVGPSQVGARVVEMIGGRHYHPIWTMMSSAVLVTIGTALLLAGWTGYAFAVLLYGAGNGIGSVARGTLPLALFGPARYPVLMGRLALPILVSMALSPLAGAVALQRGGPDLTLALLTGIAAANVLLVGALWMVSRELRAARDGV